MQCHCRLVNLIFSYGRYDNMVFEAVVGLKEPYGSSNASIASYIEVRWHFLVDWIDPLFTPYSASFEFIWFLSKRGLPPGAKACELHLCLEIVCVVFFFTLLEGATLCFSEPWLDPPFELSFVWEYWSWSLLWARCQWRFGELDLSEVSHVVVTVYGHVSTVRRRHCLPLCLVFPCETSRWLWRSYREYIFCSCLLASCLPGRLNPDPASFVWVSALLLTMALGVVSTVSFLVRTWDFKL